VVAALAGPGVQGRWDKLAVSGRREALRALVRVPGLADPSGCAKAR